MPQRKDPGKLTLCAWCGTPVEQRGHKDRLYCNAACRSKAWQQRRQQTGEERDRRIRRLLEDLQEAQESGRRILKEAWQLLAGRAND